MADIAVNFDTYLGMAWSVSINGNQLDDQRRNCIEQIDVEENADGSDTATLTVADPDFLFIEDNIFIEEATIYISMQWHNDTHVVEFSGYISAIDIDFPQNGYPQMSIYCMDRSHLMNREKKKRSWDNVHNADVAKAIGPEYGLIVKAEDSGNYTYKTEENIAQSNETDISFLEGLAASEREPFMCKVVGDELWYKKLGILSEPVGTFYYRTQYFDIVSFKPQINKETRQEEITKSDIASSDKSVEKATVKSETVKRDTQGESVKTSSNPTSSKRMSYDAATDSWISS